jgi:CBS domain-containing protein
VVVLADGVRNYMSKFLDSRWCIDLGYMEPPANEHYGQHTVADLRLDSPHALPPTATLRDALAFLQSHPEVTHLPVISEAKGLEGVVSLDSLTDALLAAPPSAPSPPVTAAFLAEFREIPADLPLAQLHYTLRKNDVAFVTHRASPTAPKALRGIVTKRDLLAFLAAATNNTPSSSSSS